MSTEHDQAAPQTGPIAWMTRNSVAANLLMFVVLAAGLIGMLRTTQEVFPEFSLDVVNVSVAYPGASPTEVEQGIVLAIEEAVRGVDGVKKVTSASAEGLGSVQVELLLGADPQQVLGDVKSEVDRIQSFPEDALEPAVALLSPRREVVSLVIAGDQDLKTLQAIGEKVRADLTTDPAVDVEVPNPLTLGLTTRTVPGDPITQVELFGVRPLEIAIEVPRETLENHGLGLDDVARQVRAQSVELPGGGVKTPDGEILLRLDERQTDAQGFRDLAIRSTLGGATLNVGDIATVVDGYAETDQESFYNGRRAVRITAYRVGTETPRSVARTMRAYERRLRAELPEDIELAIWADDSVLLDERIALLVDNGILGLILVFVVLTLLLDIRLAIWVGLGIPISFMGAFFLMPMADISINMISLFAFIVTLGLVVDDAIVVGENIYDRTQAGLDATTAAIEGAKEMAVPVTFSVLTTCAAFAPMLFVPGVMGKIFKLMPVVVISVLFFSLVESFFILPAHLGHDVPLFQAIGRLFAPVLAPVEWLRTRVNRGLSWFTEQIYSPVAHFAATQRYITVAVALGLFVLTIGTMASGLVPFNFFPKLEGDRVTATARYPYGTSVERTREAKDALEQAARQAIQENGGEGILKGMFTRLGEGPRDGGPGGGEAASGSHLVTVELNLVGSGDRDASAQDIAYAWEAAMPEMFGLDSLTFNSSVGPGAGAAVDIQLSHPDPDTLAAASMEMTDILRSYPELTNIENAYADGKRQFEFALLPQASTLGLTANAIGQQVRASFYGAEALREQRGRNEIKVMVRLPEEQRRSEFDIEELQVKTPAGKLVPLAYVAEASRSRAPTSIDREQGRRIVSVKGELAKGTVSSGAVLESLTTEVLPQLMKTYPGLKWSFAGAQREQNESMSALGSNFLLSAFVIYALLAIPFRSYSQPFIIMSAIPMGLVGAVGGHFLMRYELSMISFFGIIALSGVVVNDSLVLVDAANGYRKEGATALEAVLQGGRRRLRPILLTSLTTFMGLAPMILETSVQARFLIPMAISLGFGVLFTTVVTLLLVPALYMVNEDVLALGGRLLSLVVTPTTPPPSPQRS